MLDSYFIFSIQDGSNKNLIRMKNLLLHSLNFKNHEKKKNEKKNPTLVDMLKPIKISRKFEDMVKYLFIISANQGNQKKNIYDQEVIFSLLFEK